MAGAPSFGPGDISHNKDMTTFRAARGQWNQLTPAEQLLMEVHNELRSHSMRDSPADRYANVLSHRSRSFTGHRPFGTHTTALLE
eukprot:5369258-Prymnesium_polylepis.1